MSEKFAWDYEKTDNPYYHIYGEINDEFICFSLDIPETIENSKHIDEIVALLNKLQFNHT
jgi:hypothetical protein